MEEEICPVCPWNAEVREPVIHKLLDCLALQDAGCPIERHELTNFEWQALGVIKAERERVMAEEAKKKWQSK